MIAQLFRLGELLPKWLRPAAFGAAALFTVVSFRMLFRIPWLVQHRAEWGWGQLLLTLLAASGAGAAGGFAYTFMGAPIRRVPSVGPYLSGIVCVGAYMGALLVVWPFIAGEPLVKDQADVVIYLILTVVFGVAFGYGSRE
jgi:hypothetical protein